MNTIREGFERNSRAELPTLQARLDRLLGSMTGLQRGDSFTITYVRGQGTTVSGGGMEPVILDGADFAQALFRFWLGENPVQESLKRQLLGG